MAHKLAICFVEYDILQATVVTDGSSTTAAENNYKNVFFYHYKVDS